MNQLYFAIEQQAMARQVIEQAKALLAGQLDRDTRNRIKQHLAKTQESLAVWRDEVREQVELN